MTEIKIDPITALKDKPERSTITSERRATSARRKRFHHGPSVSSNCGRIRMVLFGPASAGRSVLRRLSATCAISGLDPLFGPLSSSGNDVFVLRDPIVVATTDNKTVSEQQHSCEWTSGSESSISKSR